MGITQPTVELAVQAKPFSTMAFPKSLISQVILLYLLLNLCVASTLESRSSDDSLSNRKINPYTSLTCSCQFFNALFNVYLGRLKYQLRRRGMISPWITNLSTFN